MRKTEGGRVPLRPHLFQGNAVTLHSQSDGRNLVAGAFRVWAQAEEHSLIKNKRRGAKARRNKK